MTFLRYINTNPDFFDYTSLEVVYDYNEVENEAPYNLEPINIQTNYTFIDLRKYTTIYALPNDIQKQLGSLKISLDETFGKLSNYSKIKRMFLIEIEETFKNKILSIGFKLDSTIDTIVPRVIFNFKNIGSDNGLIFSIKLDHYFYLILNQIKISKMDENKYNIQSMISIPINNVNIFVESLFKNITSEYKFFTRATKRINKIIYPQTSMPYRGVKSYKGKYY